MQKNTRKTKENVEVQGNKKYKEKTKEFIKIREHTEKIPWKYTKTHDILFTQRSGESVS